MAESGRIAGLARPVVAFSTLAAVALAAVLLTPREPEDDRGRLTARSAAPGGARGLREVAGRLGWRTAVLDAPLPARPRTDAVYAVLAPSQPVTPAEAHRLLDAVRGGAGLLVVPVRGSVLADSLGIRVSARGGALAPLARPACPPGSPGPQTITWPRERIQSWWLAPTRALGADTVTFARVRHAPVTFTPARDAADDDDETEVAGDSLLSPAALGFAIGRGRVVAVADPDLLRNDVIRVCRWGAGVAAVRMLDWLRAPGAGPRVLVFDELHHGARAGSGGLGVVWRAAWATPAGRTAVQCVAAAFVLLAALAPRPLAPRSRARVQRRSPLEHVSALARAYEEVGATRTATRLLVRGVRRRHPALAASGAATDADVLAAAVARHPALAADAARVRAALDRPLPPRELLAVGQAVAHIDAALRA